MKLELELEPELEKNILLNQIKVIVLVGKEIILKLYAGQINNIINHGNDQYETTCEYNQTITDINKGVIMNVLEYDGNGILNVKCDFHARKK